MTAGVGPLAGIRVLDLSALAPGPSATMLLGDLGADVITVEPPPDARGRSSLEDLPHYSGVSSRRAGANPLHRSCRSIVVDLKQDAGRGLVLRMAKEADMFLEGFRPGTCDRLGLGYDHLAARDPSVVYRSLTGYGQQGDLAMRAGLDLNYIAEAGLLSASTRPGQRPGIPLNVAADFAAGGLLAAFGILAALPGRSVSGRGTHVDVSMYEGLLGLLQSAHAWTVGGAPDPSWGNGLPSGAVPFYDCYQTADGRWLSVGALEPKFYANLCTAIGRPDLVVAHSEPSQWDDVRPTHSKTPSPGRPSRCGWRGSPRWTPPSPRCARSGRHSRPDADRDSCTARRTSARFPGCAAGTRPRARSSHAQAHTPGRCSQRQASASKRSRTCSRRAWSTSDWRTHGGRA